MTNVVNVNVEKLKATIHEMGWIYNAIEPHMDAERINEVEKRIQKVRNFLDSTLYESDESFDDSENPKY